MSTITSAPTTNITSPEPSTQMSTIISGSTMASTTIPMTTFPTSATTVISPTTTSTTPTVSTTTTITINTTGVAPIMMGYIIDVEIDMMDTSVINNLLKLVSFPFAAGDIIVITEINITTVCHLNNTGYQCRCEDQYFWPCDTCSVYQHCDDIIKGACGCISAIPNDGQFCQPMNELTNMSTCPTPSPTTAPTTIITTPTFSTEMTTNTTSTTPATSTLMSTTIASTILTSANISQHTPTIPVSPTVMEYIIEIEIDMLDMSAFDIVKYLLTIISFPFTTSEIIVITDINITTVCLLNNNGYQCRCEDQYLWPCDTCSVYQHCDDVIDGACGCISAIPNDGQFCQPMQELTNISTCLTPTPTAMPAPTTHITSPETSTQMSKNTTTPPTVTTSQEGSTQKTTTTTPTTTINTVTTTSAYNIDLSLTLNEPYDLNLNIPTSAKYMKYKSTLETTIDTTYRNVPAYQPNSALVTAFRPGSVIVDYRIIVASTAVDLASTNKQLVTSLINQGFPVDQGEVTQIVPGGIYVNSSKIYPGTTLSLSCKILTNANGKIDWAMNGIAVQNTDRIYATGNTLTVTNVNSEDSGQYSCSTTMNSIISIAFMAITVYPIPSLQTSSSKVVKCSEDTVMLWCCADLSYTVTLGIGNQLTTGSGCSRYYYTISKLECQDKDKVIDVTCQAIGTDLHVYEVQTFSINATNKAFDCFDQYFGGGTLNETRVGDCTENMVGNRTARCISAGLWDTRNQPDNCVLRVIQNLIFKAKTLVVAEIPQITANLSSAVLANAPTITQSPVNVLGIVDILQQIAFVSQTAVISPPIITNFLDTLDVIVSKGAEKTWTTLNTNSETKNTSSVLLKSIEDIGQRLSNETFGIVTNTTQLNKTLISAPYSEPFGINSTMLIDIPDIHVEAFFTFIVFSTLNTVLPVRNATNNDSSATGTSINGDVVVVKTETKVNNISFSFSIINNSLGNPQCVFWNFNLLDGLGGWDSTGCELKFVVNQTERVTCECNHTTSFSMLMSPVFLDNIALAYITYIGVSISLGSLVLCLIIETIIWKAMTRNDTSYMRHVSIVNIALSLLIADICFIIGASIVQPGEKTPVGPCSAVTFFIHFFYLVLFFWMLLSALLLFYRTVMVFSGMSRSRMMAISFTVGYGAPLLIAVITVASTAGNEGYVQRKNTCWLNWDETKALLAFVIPALTIVVINLLVLIVVIYKMLRRGVGASSQPDEKHALVVIARCVGILTPLFGLTWGFGIGTMFSKDLGIHVVFAFLNSLQGFFILVFGTLLDSKIREALAGRLSLANISSNRTRSTSAGPSSSSGLPILRTRRRNGYITAEGNDFSALSTSNSDTFRNI